MDTFINTLWEVYLDPFTQRALSVNFKHLESHKRVFQKTILVQTIVSKLKRFKIKKLKCFFSFKNKNRLDFEGS